MLANNTYTHLKDMLDMESFRFQMQTGVTYLDALLTQNKRIPSQSKGMNIFSLLTHGDFLFNLYSFQIILDKYSYSIIIMII